MSSATLFGPLWGRKVSSKILDVRLKLGLEDVVRERIPEIEAPQEESSELRKSPEMASE
jgi:hypothetical protein